MKVGEKSFEFCLPDKDKNNVCLKEFSGKWVILYFYPKDNTPGCSLEAIQFTRDKKTFEQYNAVILGISPDSPESHCSFTEKKDLSITLLSDSKHEVMTAYNVWKPKKMFGREFWGAMRTTFLIDPKGIIAHIWHKVTVPGHSKDILEHLKLLQKKKA